MTIQTFTIWLNIINSLKYQRFTTFGCKDKGTRVLEFVAKTQFLYNLFNFATSWYWKPFIFKLWKFDLFQFKAQNIKIFMTSGLELRLEFVASVQTSYLLFVWTHVYQFNGGGYKNSPPSSWDFIASSQKRIFGSKNDNSLNRQKTHGRGAWSGSTPP